MHYYKTAQVVQLVGVVGMSEKQARRRLPRMTPVKGRKDVYELDQPLDFKAGELIGLDELPKALIRFVVGGDSGGEPIQHDPKTGEPIEQEKDAAKGGAAADEKTGGKASGGKAAKGGAAA